MACMVTWPVKDAASNRRRVPTCPMTDRDDKAPLNHSPVPPQEERSVDPKPTPHAARSELQATKGLSSNPRTLPLRDELVPTENTHQESKRATRATDTDSSANRQPNMARARHFSLLRRLGVRRASLVAVASLVLAGFMGTIGTNAANSTFHAISSVFGGSHHRRRPSTPIPSLQAQLDAINAAAARDNLDPVQAKVNSRTIIGLWGERSTSYLKVFAPASYFTSHGTDVRSDEIRIYDDVGGRLQLNFRFRAQPLRYADTSGLPRCRRHGEAFCSRPTDPKNSVAQYSFKYLHTLDPTNTGRTVLVGEFTLMVPGRWEELAAFPVMISGPRIGPGAYSIRPIVEGPPRLEVRSKLPKSTTVFSLPEQHPQAVTVLRSKVDGEVETIRPHDIQDLGRVLTIRDALSPKVLEAYGLVAYWFPPQDESVMVGEYPSGATLTHSGRLTFIVDNKGFELDTDPESVPAFGPCSGQFFHTISLPLRDILGSANGVTIYSHEPHDSHSAVWKRYGSVICHE
jgi:hypothetical protein